ncbi:hypothetical protein JAB6_21840 [Janthinobacterium sp. HH104]|nr:hypothetical protein JAB6_21840 [Janthinobacterium sp. HH104]
MMSIHMLSNLHNSGATLQVGLFCCNNTTLERHFLKEVYDGSNIGGRYDADHCYLK